MLEPRDSQTIKEYLDSLQDIEVSYPHTKTLAVYTVKDVPFAYLETGKQLYRLSVQTDPQLAKLLREKYEEVSSGYKLNPKFWITIVVSGQLSINELIALINHSYQIALESV